MALVLAGCSAVACGQDKQDPAEQAPAVAAQPVTAAPAADPTTEPPPAAEPAKVEAAPAEPAPAAPATAEPAKPEPGAQAAAAPNPSANAICTEVCDRTEKLNCGPLEVCMAACAAANDGSICATEMSKFMSCALKHPVEHWECSDEGVAAIREGYCEGEQQAFMSCAMKQPG